MDDDAGIGRRLSAARRAAGMERAQLTAAVELPNLGPGTLGRVERGERHLFPHEAEAFARVLGVDVAYFYNEPAANQTLNEIAEEFRGDVKEMLGLLREAREARLGIEELLQTQQGILKRMEAAAGVLTDENVQALNDAARRLEGLG